MVATIIMITRILDDSLLWSAFQHRLPYKFPLVRSGRGLRMAQVLGSAVNPLKVKWLTMVNILGHLGVKQYEALA